jgi:glycosyltransferase involved in cell wall biosynthesis
VPHEHIASFCSAADLFVVGSHHEGSGYALMEACACGLTPVVSDIPAFHAITGGGSIGRLWRAGDSSSLADGILHVSGIDRQHARARVLAHFERTLSWPAVAQAAMRAYRDAVARYRAKTA